MQKQYLVHGAHDSTVVMEVELPDGTKAQASVICFNVELVPANAQGNSPNLVFTGSEIEGAKALFVQGSTIIVSFGGVN